MSRDERAARLCWQVLDDSRRKDADEIRRPEELEMPGGRARRRGGGAAGGDPNDGADVASSDQLAALLPDRSVGTASLVDGQTTLLTTFDKRTG
jgi:hypothetical protein